MSTKVEQKTRELCEAILDQSSGIRRRIDTFMSNSTSRTQYEAVVSKGQKLHEKQHQSIPLDAAEIADFEKTRDALLNDPVARDFLDAQEEMQELQQSVQKHVSKTLELGRLPVAEDLEEGSCGHGCGCHHEH